eukprot:CAMPEP_0206489210 /NCGR_PEP_ID=MMETSP0324_2-20121206/43041_1 /ASSEMBLY_ACC=CAM_ASM_000836 /TAXON_ID=2866 /ORGANISM="Crypthecodinium cohnii, Strain Seligo" /LENGTH=644 /DNA_ID=CAMNT_0053968719 /DNA_START=42 /DNA_END=1976 /DNA_ORIENTATION=+
MPALSAMRFASVLFASTTLQAVGLRETGASLENALEIEESHEEMKWNIFDKTGPKLLNVSQGNLGDCYFLSGLAAVANTHPDIIEKVFVGSGNINARGRSVYRLHFMLDGKDQFVAIDDMIPMKPKGYNPRFYFASFHNGDNAWPALLEKGFAKLAGSYLAISGGLQYEAFQAITQAPVDHIFQSSKDTWEESKIWDFIKTAIDNKWPVGAGTSDRDHNIGTANGHAYAIMSVDTKKGKKAIQVYNPWGTANQYTGELKDLATQYQGNYWLTLTEFASAFYSVVRARVWSNAHSSSLSIPVGAARGLSFTTSSDKPFYVQLQWPSRRTLPRGCKYDYKETNIILRVAPDKKPEKGLNSDYNEAWQSSSLRVYMSGGAGKYNIMAMAWFEKMTGIDDVSVFVYSQDPISNFHWEKEVSAEVAVNRVYGTCDTIKWDKDQWKISDETFRGSPLWKSTVATDQRIFWLEDQGGFKISPSKEQHDYYYPNYKVEELKCGWGGYLAFLNKISLAQNESSSQIEYFASRRHQSGAAALAETEADEEVCDQNALKEKLKRHYNLDNFHEMVTENKEDSMFPPEMKSIGEPGVDCGDKATGKKANCERLNSWGSITVEYGYASYVPNYNIFPLMPMMPGLPANLLPGLNKKK